MFGSKPSLLSTLAIGVVLLSSCGGPPAGGSSAVASSNAATTSPSAGAKPAGSAAAAGSGAFNIAIGIDLDVLDPEGQTTTTVANVVDYITEGLVRLDSD